MQKVADLVVRTGSYRAADGAEKSRYENVGIVMQGDDGREMMLLKRTFNPAGVPNPEDRDTVIISRFDSNREEGERPARPNQNHAPAQRPQGRDGIVPPRRPPARPQREPGDDFDDDIPF